MNGRRVLAARGIAVTVIAGLVVVFGLPDTVGSDVAGDVLYAVVVYLLIVLSAARWHPLVVGAVAVAWCVAVELFQLTGLPEAWGAVFWPVMLVLGTVFDARDLLVYGVTVVACVTVDLALSRRARARSENAP